jgi:diphthamide synthase (EF-2-diphthine--ammonia ligase)
MSNLEKLHRIACESERDTYIDPASGYQVLTSLALQKQGRCCGNSCRHCPYGHINVRGVKQSDLSIERPVLMNWIPKDGGIDVLFWSGGKDSFLTLMQLLKEKKNVVLLTSFGAHTKRVSIQNIHIKNIAMQANFFKVPLCLVPLFPNTEYKESIEQALQLITSQTGAEIERLVFGDLHLQDILEWRVNTWSSYRVYTPLFNAPYEELLASLWDFQKGMDLTITLSTELELPEQILPLGTPFTPELVEDLRACGLDAMLEHGEAHTLIFPRLQTPYTD